MLINSRLALSPTSLNSPSSPLRHPSSQRTFTLNLPIHHRPNKSTPNIPKPRHLNHPLPTPAVLFLQKRPNAIHRIGQHAKRQLPRAVIAVVFDADDRAAEGPGEGVGEDEAVAVVEDGGVEDGVESGDEGLEGGGGGEGGCGGVGDEDEGGGGVGYAVGFWSLEGAVGC